MPCKKHRRGKRRGHIHRRFVHMKGVQTYSVFMRKMNQLPGFSSCMPFSPPEHPMGCGKDRQTKDSSLLEEDGMCDQFSFHVHWKSVTLWRHHTNEEGPRRLLGHALEKTCRNGSSALRLPWQQGHILDWVVLCCLQFTPPSFEGHVVIKVIVV